jgi:hypothetical protein
MVRDLPVSHLEVCTAAFSTLAIITYAANWAKPKDIEVPILVANQLVIKLIGTLGSHLLIVQSGHRERPGFKDSTEFQTMLSGCSPKESSS